MGFVQYANALVQHGYAVASDAQTFYGSENGVPFTASIVMSSVNAVFMLEGWLDTSEKRAFRSKLKLVGYRASFTANKQLTLSFKLEKGREAEHIFETFAAFTLAALDAGVHFSATCPFCGADDTDAFMFCPDMKNYPSGYRSVHQSCVVNAVNTTTETAQADEGNYLTGIIGAFLGAVIGALPTVFTIWQTQTIYSIICALIPFGAFFGYKLFRGRMNNASLVITALFSLLGAFVIQAGLDIINSIVYYGYTFAEAFTLMAQYLPANAEYRAFFFEGFGQVLLFVGLGYVTSYFLIKQKTNTGKAKAFLGYKSTLTLKPGVQLIEAFRGPYYQADDTTDVK